MSHDDLRLSRGVLYTRGGAIKVKRIGKGAFSVAMVAVDPDPNTGARDVFLFSDDETPDKELLSMAHDSDARNPHIPSVEKLGHTHDKTVYVMPLYRVPLRKSHDIGAWKDYLAIKRCHDRALKAVGRVRSGYDVNFETVECAKESGLRRSVVDALETLMDTAANYGSEYAFEFSPRNLGTDADGNLVLLDVLYDKEALVRRRMNRTRNPARPPRTAATRRVVPRRKVARRPRKRTRP